MTFEEVLYLFAMFPNQEQGEYSWYITRKISQKYYTLYIGKGYDPFKMTWSHSSDFKSAIEELEKYFIKRG